MYRWLLCCRYLRTRYIALASVISVTLGVATLIVVNSVMEGFAVEMHSRMHGILSDVIIDCHSADGLVDPDAHMERIREVIGDRLEGATTVVHVPALLAIPFYGQVVTRQVNLIGVDRETYGQVSDFGQFLLHPENRRNVSFTLHEDGYAPDRKLYPDWGWNYRRAWAAEQKRWSAEQKRVQAEMDKLASLPVPAAPANVPADTNPAEVNQVEATELPPTTPLTTQESANPAQTPAPSPGSLANVAPGGVVTQPQVFDPAKDQFCGIILGIATCSVRDRAPNGDVRDTYYCRPGDDVRLMFAGGGDNPKVLQQQFTVVDLYESGMSEYDATFAFVPLDQLQLMRGMVDPISGTRSVTSIQLRLKDGVDASLVRDELRAIFPIERYPYQIQTWRDLQGPLLAAVRLETTILNLLLFLIIAVAGFGILATFFMIVVEKTRDIGILKALGASGMGVMSIFLNYGLLLGIVGSGVGMVGGLLFVHYINDIAKLIEKVTGQEVFDPTVYYFNEIPTIVEPFTVLWVVVGAVIIAVGASVLPALRAARLHPVVALRYE